MKNREIEGERLKPPPKGKNRKYLEIGDTREWRERNPLEAGSLEYKYHQEGRREERKEEGKGKGCQMC